MRQAPRPSTAGESDPPGADRCNRSDSHPPAHGFARWTSRKPRRLRP